MNLNEWQRQLDQMHEQVASLNQRAHTSNQPQTVLRETLEALSVTLEQLTVSGEELHQQQEELVTAHAQAETERRRYQDLFEFAPDGYLVTDAKGKIREANQTAARLLNMNQRGLLAGRLLLTFLLPEDQPAFMELLRRLTAGQLARSWRLRLWQGSNKEPLWVSVVAQPMHNEPGSEVTGIRWLLRDVSKEVAQEQTLQASQAALAEANATLEQRVTERTADLRASEERFRLVLQGSPVTVFQQDTDLRYTWIHNPVEPYSPADVIGKTEDEVLEPENAARLNSIKRRVLETGQSFREQVPRVLPDKTFWYDMKLEPRYDQEGVLIGLTGVITDITDYHRQVETQRFLNDVSNLLITSQDPDSLLQHIARTVSERVADCCVFALPNNNGGIDLRAIHHHTPEHTEPLRGWLEQGLQQQAEQHPFWRAIHGTQTVYVCDDTSALAAAVGGWSPLPVRSTTDTETMTIAATLVAVALMARGQIIGVMGLLNDHPTRHYGSDDLHLAEELARRVALALDTTLSYETALHAHAEAEQALRLHDQVFGLISHDLKTPLTTIHGYVYLLRRQLATIEDGPKKDKLLRDNDKIATATKQMANQIDELLHVARMQAGEALHLERQPVDLLPLVQRLVDAHQTISDRHSIQVYTPLTELMVVGDETQLERVFTNLLSNAVKYSPEGSEICVTLITEERDSVPGTLVSIRDQGIGIPTADLPYLFEPFRRGSNLRPEMSGTGLGLVSTRYVVEQHGGSISVASEEGSGSTFAVWLPLHELP